MKILSIGDRIRPGAYAVRSRFVRSALLFDGTNRALFVVDESIGPGPLNLVVRNPDAFVVGDALEIPRRPRAPIYESSLPRLNADQREKLLRILADFLPRHAPPDSLVSLFAPAETLPRLQPHREALFQKAFALFAAGRLAAGVRLLRGCGAGLTPSGDDFLCGWMLACRLRRTLAPVRTILENALGQNPVSNAFLELSAKGRVNIAVKKLLQAPSSAAVKAVCAFGHSSGADWLCGLLFGLGHSEFRIQNPE